jgi:hypothetical protein
MEGTHLILYQFLNPNKSEYEYFGFTTYFCGKSKMMMKFTITCFILFLISLAYSQKPDTLWTRTYGGSSTELYGTFATVSLSYGRWAEIAADEYGNILIATTSTSSDGDVLNNEGSEDIWILAINSTGDTLWTRIFGGSESERILRICPATGGGWYIVGHSRSSGGVFSANHTTDGYADAFVLKLDSDGNQLWMKMYGGSSDDFLNDIIETSDGFLIACGEAYSTNGDLAGTSSGLNWGVKIDPSTGNLIWSKTWSGPDAASPDWLENVFRLAQMSDGTVVMTGYTTPSFNDFNLDRVNILKIDLSGNLLWSKKIGAPGSGDYPAAILPAENGSFYILAKLAATVGGSGDASEYFGGGGDFWLVKLDSLGNIVFERNYGGSELDVPYDMKPAPDGGLYLAGMTRSVDNDAAYNPLGGTDFWLIKTNSSGDTIYTLRMGGSANDFCSSMTLVPNSLSMYMAGGTDSNDGMVHGFHGVRDLWVVHLENPPGTVIDENEDIECFLYPNPASDYLFLSDQYTDVSELVLRNYLGCIVFSASSDIDHGFSVASLSPGYYIAFLYQNGGKPVKKQAIIIVR